MRIRQGLTFDDVLLVPRNSNISSRGLISLSVDLGKDIKLEAPVVSANMKNVTGKEMAAAIGQFGGLGLLHRFADLETQKTMLRLAANYAGYGAVGCSIGVGNDDFENASALFEAGCRVLCIDVAHGDHVLALEDRDDVVHAHRKEQHRAHLHDPGGGRARLRRAPLAGESLRCAR